MIVWGSTFVVTKAAASEIPPATLAALRFLVASIVLAPMALARGGFARLPRPVPWATLSWMALTGIAAFTLGFNYALAQGSASQGALIFALVPAAVTLAAILFLQERPSRTRLAGIVLAILGVILLAAAGRAGDQAPQPLLGALWMVTAIVSWAAYTVLAKRLAQIDHIVTIAVVSVIGTAMLAPLAVAESIDAPWSSPSTSAWLGLLFLGVAASALAYVVYGYVLRELDATTVGVYSNLDPIVGVATAVLFLGETLHAGQVVGGLVALAGMWLASRPD
jgi:drug/metabolite transporter (DMT)-like permease